LDAFGPAWANMKRVLFQPFQLRKWLKLGLIAMLAGVAGGGGGGGGGGGAPPGGGGTGGGGGGGGGPEEVFEQIAAWFHAHQAAVLTGALALGAFIIVFALVMLYVSSVFRFIFLESVITGEARIRDPWHRNKAQGLSFMGWRLGFGFLALLAFGLFVGLPVGLMILSLVRQTGGTPSVHLILSSIGLVLLALFLLFVVLLIIGLISALTRDFVLPLMYLRRSGVIGAWREFWPILTQNRVGFLVYFLLKVLAAMVSGIAGLFLTLAGLLVAACPLGLLGLLGYGLVAALGIDSWSWSYLWAIVPTAFVVIMALAYWITCVILPIPVFFQSYALKYLGLVEPSAATI
jgi:hypothetical protein